MEAWEGWLWILVHRTKKRQIQGVAHRVGHWNRRTERRMFWISMKHLFVGAFFVLIGTLIVNDDAAFHAASTPAELIVLQVDSRKTTDGRYEKRITFGLVTEVRPRPEYRGGFWANIAMHRPGDIVAGRYDPTSGEMHSDRMLLIRGWIARLVQLLGVVAMVQGVLILFGIPETRMPLPVRIGRDRRTMFKL
jgi:hypothetical protein